MSAAAEDDAAREVAAMQFAGGASIAHLATEWDREQEWVEESIRRVMLAAIPRRDGGLKATREEVQAANRAAELVARDAQGELEL